LRIYQDVVIILESYERGKKVPAKRELVELKERHVNALDYGQEMKEEHRDRRGEKEHVSEFMFFDLFPHQVKDYITMRWEMRDVK